MKRLNVLGLFLIILAAPLLTGPGWDLGVPEDLGPAYPTRIVDAKTGKPVSGLYIYTDVPGDNTVKLENRFFLAKADGSGTRTYAGIDLNVYWNIACLDKSVVQSMKESDFTKINTGQPVDGVLVIKLPIFLKFAPLDPLIQVPQPSTANPQNMPAPPSKTPK